MTVYSGPRLTALEARIGRQLTAAERHMQVETIDALLNRAKDLLDAEIRREQARLAAHIAEHGGGGRMEMTPRMAALVKGLRDHGRAHAANELASMGYPVKPRKVRALAASEDELLARLRARLDKLTIKVQHEAVGMDLSELAVGAIEKALVKVLGARSIAADLVAPAFSAGLADTFEQHADLIEQWQISAILDGSTCDPCAGWDGEIFESVDALMEVMPGFGGVADCDGGSRCRCRALPVPPE